MISNFTKKKLLSRKKLNKRTSNWSFLEIIKVYCNIEIKKVANNGYTSVKFEGICEDVYEALRRGVCGRKSDLVPTLNC